MSKRLREEQAIAVSIASTHIDSKNTVKKRKTEDIVPRENPNGNILPTKSSKEERRELRRLRKLVEASSDQKPQKGNVTQRIRELELKKKTRKAARKAEKEQANTAEIHVAENISEGEDGYASLENKARCKAERKVEKERRKIHRSGENGIVDNPDGAVSSTSAEPLGKGQRDWGYKECTDLAAISETEIQSFLSNNFIAVKDPSSTKPLRPITNFSYLPQSSQSPAFSTFKAPTAIQAAAWPFLLSSRDVIGVAETGSGKTLAFGIPCIRSVSSSPSSKKSKTPARAVIVSPTRELAVQIHTQIESLAIPAKLRSVCVYGGVPKEPQRLALSTAHIVVATPGRLNDLIEEGHADLSQVKYLVLDEADRMLEKGFEDAIRKIISTTPRAGRQTLMFTATWPESVRELAATFMNEPVHITIGDNNADGELRANIRIEQQVEVVDPRGKEQRMLQIIKKYQSGENKNDRILVFCLYKKEATRVEGFIRSKGLRVAGIHGDLSQSARMAALEGFKKGGCPLLVATDVAARGLDIPNVKLVLNVTFPLTVEDYVHRIGRTGRAGARGLAITLFTEHDKAQSGALINVLKAAGQPVPEELLKFGTTVKKKGHDAYGAFYKDTRDAKGSTKIKFDD
ncbi:MAG: hypothetical protein Q9219_005478 [cf. Caloplaca sp. 3 TL-2023]